MSLSTTHQTNNSNLSNMTTVNPEHDFSSDTDNQINSNPKTQYQQDPNTLENTSHTAANYPQNNSSDNVFADKLSFEDFPTQSQQIGRHHQQNQQQQQQQQIAEEPQNLMKTSQFHHRTRTKHYTVPITPIRDIFDKNSNNHPNQDTASLVNDLKAISLTPSNQPESNFNSIRDDLDSQFIQSLDASYCHKIQRDYPCQYVTPVNSTLKCSICHDIVCYPLVLDCGHNACLRCCDPNLQKNVSSNTLDHEPKRLGAYPGHATGPPPTFTQSALTLCPGSNLPNFKEGEVMDEYPPTNNFSKNAYARASLPRSNTQFRDNNIMQQISSGQALNLSQHSSNQRSYRLLQNSYSRSNYNSARRTGHELGSNSPSNSSENVKKSHHSRTSNNDLINKSSINSNTSGGRILGPNKVFCNLCQKTVTNTKIRSIALQTQVMNLIIKCKNKSCTETLKLCLRTQHEDKCQLEEVKCKNSTYCGVFLKNQLEEHYKVCQYVPCLFQEFGCQYTSTKADMEKHQENCPYLMNQQTVAYRARVFLQRCLTVYFLTKNSLIVTKTTHSIKKF